MNKILFISGSPVIRGAEYVLGDYINRSKIKERILVLHNVRKSCIKFYGQLPVRNIPCRYMNPPNKDGNSRLRYLKKMKNFLCSIVCMRNIFQRENVCLVIGNNTQDIVYSLYAALYRKIFFLYIHDIIEKGSLFSWLIRVMDRFVQKYITVSHAAETALIDIGVSRTKIEVIYNGLSPSLSKNGNSLKKVRDNGWKFGYVGALEERKNPFEFIEWIEKFAETETKGSGAMVYSTDSHTHAWEERLKRYVEKKALPVVFVGTLSRSEMEKFYDSLDFLVVPSLRDPFPTVVLEAMNRGIPVIGRKSDGIPEMIEDGYNGYLYESKSDFVELSKKLSTCNYEQMSKNAVMTVKNRFDIAKKVEKLDRLIESSCQ